MAGDEARQAPAGHHAGAVQRGDDIPRTQARGLGPPTYVVTEREGPDHAPRFTVEARIADRPPASASGSSRREAEQGAAAMMLAELGVDGG